MEGKTDLERLVSLMRSYKNQVQINIDKGYSLPDGMRTIEWAIEKAEDFIAQPGAEEPARRRLDPPEALRESARTYEERNAIYGDNYKFFGRVMSAMFPEGVQLSTPDDFNRFGVFVQVVSKITRYANQFGAGGHDDSLLDISTYAAMLRELDSIAGEEYQLG